MTFKQATEMASSSCGRCTWQSILTGSERDPPQKHCAATLPRSKPNSLISSSEQRTLRRCEIRHSTLIFALLLLLSLAFEARAFVVPKSSIVNHNNKNQKQSQRRHEQQTVLFESTRRNGRTRPKESLDIELREMEQEVIGSTKAKLDLRRVSTALSSELESTGNPDIVANSAAPWQLATAAAVTASVGTYIVTNNQFFTTVVFIGSFVAALGDPIEEEGLAGSLARLVGRQTIKTVETSKPKIRAVVRAIADEEKIESLEEEVKQLREENARLKLWQTRRMAIDEVMPYFSRDELKDLARRHRLPASGTKTQLVVRLVENNVIALDED